MGPLIFQSLITVGPETLYGFITDIGVLDFITYRSRLPPGGYSQRPGLFHAFRAGSDDNPEARPRGIVLLEAQ